jgi:hypothetical protein
MSFGGREVKHEVFGLGRVGMKTFPPRTSVQEILKQRSDATIKGKVRTGEMEIVSRVCDGE